MGITDGDLDGDSKHKQSSPYSFCCQSSPFSHVIDFFFVSHLPTPTAPSGYFVLWNDNIIPHLMHSKDSLTSKARRCEILADISDRQRTLKSKHAKRDKLRLRQRRKFEVIVVFF